MVDPQYDQVGFTANDSNLMPGVSSVVPGEIDGDHLVAVVYVCGKCGKDNKLDSEAVVKCLTCGGRIFYKKRERKLI
jgi:DNA-directed RNA polymerase subunit RPC12/RpoP